MANAMNIYVRELSTGTTFQFPMLPPQIEVKAATRFLSYDIMKIGEVKLPCGEELTAFSWSGILPGEARKNDAYVLAWQDPKACQGRFSQWRNRGEKLLLTVTGTTINHAVYLEDYTCTYSGGFGDIEYTISFCVAKDILIDTVETAKSNIAAAKTTNVSSRTTASDRAGGKTTYTVKSGDSIWSIAQSQLGDGNRWKEIYNLNKAEIDAKNKGKNVPYATIYSGQVFNLPAK